MPLTSPVRACARRKPSRTKIAGMTQRSDSEARLAAIVASSDDAIISKDLDGRIMSWNATAERLLGYTPAEAIGQSVTMVIPMARLNEEVLVLSKIRTGLPVRHFVPVRQHKYGAQVDASITD